MDSCALYPDIVHLTTGKIQQKINEVNCPMKAGFSLTSMTMARVLKQDLNGPLETILTRLEQCAVLETNAKKLMIHRSNSAEELCQVMQEKRNSDKELFLQVLQDIPNLPPLVNFVTCVITRCKEMKSGNTNQEECEESSLLDQHSLKIRVPKRCEDSVIKHVTADRSRFRRQVLFNDIEVGAVSKHCILITLEKVSEWDLANLRLDQESGVLHNRLIHWLREHGLNLTDEEASSVRIDFTVEKIEKDKEEVNKENEQAQEGAK